MAVSLKFEGINRRFENNPADPSPDQDGPFLESEPMWAYTNGTITFTRWKITPEEMEEIAETGEIWLAVRCGERPMQPHWLGSLGWIKHACADFGGLWRVRDINQPKPKQLPPPDDNLEPA